MEKPYHLVEKDEEPKTHSTANTEIQGRLRLARTVATRATKLWPPRLE